MEAEMDVFTLNIAFVLILFLVNVSKSISFFN